MTPSKPSHFLFVDVRQFGGLNNWLLFRLLPTLICLAMCLAFLFSASPSRAQVEVVSEEGPEMMMYWGDDQYSPAVMQSSQVHFDINGMVATVSLEQTFNNTSPGYAEAVYRFPLPENAAVRHMEMRVGERLIIGEIREKEVAQKIYNEARVAGKKASLVEQQRPNMFTNRVANIAPGERIVVKLEYVQTVDYRSGLFSLRFPSTITPRYMPGQILLRTPQENEDTAESLNASTEYRINPVHGWAMPTDEVPDADLISPYLLPFNGSDSTPTNAISITAKLDMGMPLASVESSYHEIALSRRAGVYDIALVSGTTEMNRDFVLQWQPLPGTEPTAALFTEKLEDEYYGLLMLIPPLEKKAAKPLARDVTFVIDTSGSMGGTSMIQAKESLSLALSQLKPEDQFNIIEFDSNYQSLFRHSQLATSHYLQVAADFVRHLNASGGTEMMSALKAALHRSPSEQDETSQATRIRQVVFITDGAVGNESALFAEIQNTLGDTRLFTVGIGSAPNSWFMRKAAQFGRGTFTYIGDVNEVSEKMTALFAQLSQPVAVGLSVDFPSSAQAWPQRMPDLYQGEPLVLAVKFGKQLPVGSLTVSGRLAGNDWATHIEYPQQAALEVHGADVNSQNHSGIATLWARKNIAALMDDKYFGKTEEEVKAQVLPIALQHQLLSAYTSFVAVEEVVSRPATQGVKSLPVANTPPKGQAPQAFAYPSTATTARANIWLGMLMLMLAVILKVARQEEVERV